MKRIRSSDSPASLISIRKSREEQSFQNVVYGGEFKSMMEGYVDEEEACLVEEAGGSGGGGQKKRRLSVDQVKALEKSFDLENKLEPERKVKLAQELGLQPRQVAVWFQNRRARWKTKLLEKDFGGLNAQYDSLKQKFENLQSDNKALLNQVRKLKSKLGMNTESDNVGEKEGLGCESENPPAELQTTTIIPPELQGPPMEELEAKKQSTQALDFKDAGPSDSESSSILNTDDTPKTTVAAAPFGVEPSGTAAGASAVIHGPNNFENATGFEFLNLDSGLGYYSQYQVKMEEHNFFTDGNFFSEVDKLNPTFQWYNPENGT